MKPCILALLLMAGRVLAADDEGFVALFNGRDLSGWVNVNCAPDTWRATNGLIHCTGHPIGALRTVQPYENFILDLEWRHLTPGGNSGVFIWASPIAAPGVPFLRAIEVQVLDHGYNAPGKNEWYTTHGDVFPIHGATMKPFGRHNGMRSFPSEERSKGTPEWNHYRIVCSNGVIRLQVNGKEVSGGEECIDRKGYLGLESEGAPVEFRNLRLKELPSSGAREEFTAPVDRNWRPLFTGLDLRGWHTDAGASPRWRVRGEQIALPQGRGKPEGTLWTDAEFGDAEFIVDCRPARRPEGEAASIPVVQVRGLAAAEGALRLDGATAGAYRRFFIGVKGRDVTLKCGEEGETRRMTLPADVPARGRLGLSDTGGEVEFMNVYARDL